MQDLLKQKEQLEQQLAALNKKLKKSKKVKIQSPRLKVKLKS